MNHFQANLGPHTSACIFFAAIFLTGPFYIMFILYFVLILCLYVLFWLLLAF